MAEGEGGLRDEVGKHTTCYPSSRVMDESAKRDREQGKRAVVLWAKKRASGPVKWEAETMRRGREAVVRHNSDLAKFYPT